MEAGIEGAGPERAFGVSIRLPFETSTTQFIADDPKLVNFRYFFTRKLTFLKESDGFVLLPGGFGTLDEAFELLTLVQTGKAQPGPIVLLDVPGGTYWQTWRHFVGDELLARNYISADDLSLVHVTDDVDAAVDEVDRLLLELPLAALRRRAARAPHASRARRRRSSTRLNAEFADIVARGRIERIETTPAELADGDHVDLERLGFRFDRHGWARLRVLIDHLNGRASQA